MRSGITPTINALALILILLTIIGVLVYEVRRRRAERAALSPAEGARADASDTSIWILSGAALGVALATALRPGAEMLTSPLFWIFAFILGLVGAGVAWFAGWLWHRVARPQERSA